jgi:hypothetical protein
MAESQSVTVADLVAVRDGRLRISFAKICGLAATEDSAPTVLPVAELERGDVDVRPQYAVEDQDR